jgi:hypothetical protein
MLQQGISRNYLVVVVSLLFSALAIFIDVILVIAINTNRIVYEEDPGGRLLVIVEVISGAMGFYYFVFMITMVSRRYN